jgi:group I intron endonuclease
LGNNFESTPERSRLPFSQHSKINFLYKWGVYKITNKITGDFYIGSSLHLAKRFSNHKYDLRRGTHPNHKLQNDFTIYGEDNFSFTTLIFCDVCNLEYYEKMFVMGLNPTYNIHLVDQRKESAEVVASKKSKNGNYAGRKWTDAQREHYSAARTGMKMKKSPYSKTEEAWKRKSVASKAGWEKRRNAQKSQ